MVIQESPTLVAIVGGDPFVRNTLQRVMKEVCIPALTFASAEEFLESPERHRPACLIAEIRLPGMSGLELQASLNRQRFRIPIIFITEEGDEKLRMQALRSGAVEFLAKPFNSETLLDRVRAALQIQARGSVGGQL